MYSVSSVGSGDRKMQAVFSTRLRQYILGLGQESKTIGHCRDVLKVVTCLQSSLGASPHTPTQRSNTSLKMRNKMLQVLVHPSNARFSYSPARDQGYMCPRDPPSGQKIVSSTVSGVPGIDANLAACDTASSVTAAKLHPSISCEPHVVHILILGMLHL